MKRLFGSLFAPNNPLDERPAGIITDSPLNPPDTGLAALRKRRTPALDEYTTYLGSEPSRKDYQQGKVGKILSSIAGFTEGIQRGPGSGIKTAQALMDRPYQEARSDWESKGGRLKELAGLEYQKLGDEEKLEVKIAADKLAQDKELHDWIKDQKGFELTAAQIDNLKSQIKNRGKSLQKNEKTGNLEIVDIQSGARQSLGQFMESPEQKDLREFGRFRKEEGIRQEGRESLQEDRQAHDKFMEGLKFSNDKTLAKLKSDLDKANPNATQSNAAYEGAMSEVLQENPELKEQLFTSNPDGSVTLKDKYNNDVYYMMVNAVRQRAAKKLSQKPEIPTSTGRQRTPPPMMIDTPSDIPIINMPQENDTRNTPAPPTMNQADQTAIQELAKIGIANPTPEMIAEAKKDLGLQ